MKKQGHGESQEQDGGLAAYYRKTVFTYTPNRNNIGMFAHC